MYKCEKCKRTSYPQEPQHKVVTQMRDKTYIDRFGNTSKGWEIVTELKVCDVCFNKSVN